LEKERGRNRARQSKLGKGRKDVLGSDEGRRRRSGMGEEKERQYTLK
jgi:hypothetical protein